ncbi:MAG: hypothetical protein FJ150_04385 [Euryarchaeota archaeon]|nr:hypothetical protein [Euryarchaeota archaeon]
MRLSYGIMDRKKILAYKPELFHKTDDLLIFPSEDFNSWHSGILEYIDGLYQINSKIMEKGEFVDTMDLNLATGVISNIKFEIDGLFNSKEVSGEYYLSKVDDKYKKRRKSLYGIYMQKIDRTAPIKMVITNKIRYKHLIEIIRYSEQQFDQKYKKRSNHTINKKKQTKISQLL